MDYNMKNVEFYNIINLIRQAVFKFSLSSFYLFHK